MFDEAIERAKYCDEYLAREGKPIGPLHGLPISLKVHPLSPSTREVERWPLSPTLSRVFYVASKALVDAGHELVDIVPLLPKDIMVKAMLVAFSMFSIDPQSTAFKNIAKSGEPIIPSIPTTMLEELKNFKPDLNSVWDLNVEAKKVREMVRDLWVKESL